MRDHGFDDSGCVRGIRPLLRLPQVRSNNAFWAVDQNTLIRLTWQLRDTVRMPDRPLMELLGLAEPAPFRMDRAYLAGLVGYVVERYWLLERSR